MTKILLVYGVAVVSFFGGWLIGVAVARLRSQRRADALWQQLTRELAERELAWKNAIVVDTIFDVEPPHRN